MLKLARSRERRWCAVWVALAVTACSGDAFRSDGVGGVPGGGGENVAGTSSSGAGKSGAGGAPSGTGGANGGGSSGGGGSNVGGAVSIAGTGSGGTPGSGGLGISGTSFGGASVAGAGGGVTVHGPLLISDLVSIDAKNLEGFNAVGFRCKALSVCAPDHDCIYFLDHFGSVQSGEDAYDDGLARTEPAAVRIEIAAGAQSACATSTMMLEAGQTIDLVYDQNRQLNVHFPDFSGTELTLYVAADGSTYYDQALTQPAQPAL